MRIFLYRMLCCLGVACGIMTAPAVAESDHAAPRGSLVIMGGAVRPDNAEIWRRLVELTGEAKPRFAIIAAAAADPVASAQRISEALSAYGAESFLVPIAPRLKDADFRKNAQDVDIAQKIAAADGIFLPAVINHESLRHCVRRTANLLQRWTLCGPFIDTVVSSLAPARVRRS